jgi:hypothetical protein
MANIVGSDFTNTKIVPILMDLSKDDNAEVRLNVINKMKNVYDVVQADLLTPVFLKQLDTLSKDSQWRVRMATIELVGDISVCVSKDTYFAKLHDIFIQFMTNSAAAVRDMGIQKVPLLMQKFGYQFAKEYLMKEAEKVYNQEKCPFHFRISCLRTIGAIWVGRDKEGNRFQTQALNGDETQTLVKQCMPLWQKAFRDNVANVKFV